MQHLNFKGDELVIRGIVTQDKMKTNKPWKTNEFGFYDLNRNAIFLMEDALNNF